MFLYLQEQELLGTFSGPFVRYFLGTFSGTFQGTYPRFEFRFRSMSGMKLETRRISGSGSDFPLNTVAILFGSISPNEAHLPSFMGNHH